MKQHKFNISGAALAALGSGALWWPEQGTLIVSDLHLGKSERIARLGGPLLPPFENRETLERLEQDIIQTKAKTIICLGDSFDDSEAGQRLEEDASTWIMRLQAGRKWIWIEGNHDPGPISLSGAHLSSIKLGPLTFRHVASVTQTGEVSGHYHPKISVGTRRHAQSRRCFLYDDIRVILPAYGAYTGGLKSNNPVFRNLFRSPAFAVLTGQTPRVLPLRT